MFPRQTFWGHITFRNTFILNFIPSDFIIWLASFPLGTKPTSQKFCHFSQVSAFSSYHKSQVDWRVLTWGFMDLSDGLRCDSLETLCNTVCVGLEFLADLRFSKVHNPEKLTNHWGRWWILKILFNSEILWGFLTNCRLKNWMPVSKSCFHLGESQQISDDVNDKEFQGDLPLYFLDWLF